MTRPDFNSRLSELQARADRALLPALGDMHCEFNGHANNYLQRLFEASVYALKGGGKRIRPALVYAAAQAIDPASAPPAALDTVACAVEFVHTYSLVHDDLPALDNDDLRRGQAATHKAYDEATAILVGDALQVRAFELIACERGFTPTTRIALIKTLSAASGCRGMVGGQAIDIEAVGKCVDAEHLEAMHALKTGALIRASVVMGATAAAASREALATLDRYARAIGLAFQVSDDILDASASTEQLGKSARTDAALNKPTYVSLLGLDGARAKADGLLREAEAVLAEYPGGTDTLLLLARHIVTRRQ